MPYRKLSTQEMETAQKLFDHIVAAEYGGAPDDGEPFPDYILRIWERCASAVIEPPVAAADPPAGA